MRANERILFSPLVIIDENGENIGQMSKFDALTLARSKDLDLVEINPTARPPICKIMDFGKFKYDNSKKAKETKAKQKIVELKEIRLTAKIGDHDLSYKAKNAKEFFDRGDQVKVSMRLRGRENIFGEKAFDVFTRFAAMADLDYERAPLRAGNQITAMLTAKKKESIKPNITPPAK